MEMIHHHFETLSSTNDWAKQKIASFDPNKLTLITAEMQTNGRGQFGRKWISPKGENLYASFCFFTHDLEPLVLTHLFAHALVDVLEQLGIRATIKLPNDLHVEEKKIAGILTETVPIAQKLGVIIGVGLNVNMSEEELKQIDQPATSLKKETGKEWEIEQILEKIVEKFPIV